MFNMGNWFYKGEEVLSLEQFPEGAIGFVYKITRKSDGSYYIGKKNLHSERTKALTKKELAENKQIGKRTKKKKVISESDWKTYYGSEKELKDDVATYGADAFVREILQICYHKKQLTYQELRHQILENWEAESCYNKQILGKIWKKDT